MSRNHPPTRHLSGHVVLTGATGLVGGAVLADLLSRTDAEVTCLVRADNAAIARERVEPSLATWMDAGAREHAAHRVHALPADIGRVGLGLDANVRADLIRRCNYIVHCAASVRFDESLAHARAVNVAGAARVLELADEAHAADALQRVTMVSTAFVSGITERRFSEHELDRGQAFRNTYERSKFEAELQTRAAMARLPLNVVRPSIVIGHSLTGRTTAFNVLYAPLRMAVRRGTDVTLPVRGDLPIDVVPVDWVARMIVEALTAGEDGQTYSAASGTDSPTMGDLASITGEAFGVATPGLLPSAVSNEVVGESLGVWRDLLSPRGRAAMSVYEPYLTHPSQFDTWRGDHLMWRAGVRPFDPRRVLRRSLAYAHATDFGRRLHHDPAMRAQVATRRPARAVA
jgi:thioester reductase-like protein